MDNGDSIYISDIDMLESVVNGRCHRSVNKGNFKSICDWKKIELPIRSLSNYL